MTDTQDAVAALQRLGMKVKTLSGAQGFRFQITTQAGHEYQFNRLDTKRAGLVLYALQTASSNLANGAAFQPTAGATAAGRYEDFEKDFQLDGDVPDLKVDQADDQQAEIDEHSAKIAQIEEMAEAYTKLDKRGGRGT